MIIDATNTLVGRMATRVAKASLLGEEIHIVNCDKAVISGDKWFHLHKFKNRADRGNPAAGPFIPKQSHRLVKRIIRGMLPYKNANGKAAMARIRCYVGVPDAFKDQKFESFKEAQLSKLQVLKYVRIGDIAQHLGGKL